MHYNATYQLPLQNPPWPTNQLPLQNPTMTYSISKWVILSPTFFPMSFFSWDFWNQSHVFTHRKVWDRSPTFPHRNSGTGPPSSHTGRSGTSPRPFLIERSGTSPRPSHTGQGPLPAFPCGKVGDWSQTFLCGKSWDWFQKSQKKNSNQLKMSLYVKKIEQNNLSLTFLSGKVWDWFQKSQKIFLKSTQNVLKCEKITSPWPSRMGRFGTHTVLKW